MPILRESCFLSCSQEKFMRHGKVVRVRILSSPLGKTLTEELDLEGSNALSYLKKYFGKGRCMVSIIRNEFAFHYSKADLRYVVEMLSRSRYRSVFVDANHRWNNFYEAGEFAFMIHYAKLLGITDRKKKLKFMYEESGEVGGEMLALLHGLLKVFTDELLEGSGRNTQATLITITEKIKLDDAKFPVLVDLGSCSAELESIHGIRPPPTRGRPKKERDQI